MHRLNGISILIQNRLYINTRVIGRPIVVEEKRINFEAEKNNV